MPVPIRLQVEALEGRDTPAVAYALGAANTLIPFDTAGPAFAAAPFAVSGLTAGDTLASIDFRPQTGGLYGLGYNGTAGTVQLYTISQRTGVATKIGATGGFVDAAGNPVRVGTDAGTRIGIDFHPTADRLRVVTSDGQNFRINPNTGSFVDGDLNQPVAPAGVNMDAPINGGTNSVQETAYTNNAPSATATTQYTLDPVSRRLFVQSPPNAGTQSAGVGVTAAGASLAFTSVDGFDIAPGVDVSANGNLATGQGLAFFTVGTSTQLYRLDLTTGSATVVAGLPGNPSVRGLAIQGEAVAGGLPAVGLSGNGTQLVRFNTAATTAPVGIDISGVAGGEQLVGIDFRPGTGLLYGLGVNSTNNTGTLYQIDPQTAIAMAVGAFNQIAFVDAGGTAIDLPPASAGYGVDFNPLADLLRVVTGSGLNFRVNPVTGAPVDGNLNNSTTPPAGVNPDGPINGATGSASGTAYTNSFAGAAATTQYTLDAATNRLFIQNPSNAGTLAVGTAVTVGGQPLDFSATTGFDIPAGVQTASSGTPTNGVGYAALSSVTGNRLYALNLSTGAATDLGAVGASQALAGLTVADGPTGSIAFSTISYIASRAAGSATITLTRTGGTAGTATVQVIAFGGTAVAGTDYTGLPATVTFVDGQPTATLVLPLATGNTGPKTVFVAITSPTNAAVVGAVGTATLTINDGTPSVGPREFSAGLGAGGGAGAYQYNPDGSVKFSLTAFPGSNPGGVRVATADVTGDGVPDLIAVTGPGSVTLMKVFNGVSRTEIFSTQVFESAFTGGLFVSAGDMSGDGKADIVLTPDEGGGPRVIVLRGGDFVKVADFFGIDDTNFRGGARTAVGDVNGDGQADLAVAAGNGGGPRVSVLGGASVVANAPTRLFNDIFVFESTLRNGVFVTLGDLDGDGKADVVVGGGPGGGPRVFALSGAGLLANVSTAPTLANYFAGDPNSRSGVRVTAKNLDGDAKADVVTAAGTGSRVIGYSGASTPASGTPATTLFSFDVVPGFANGVFVG